MSDATDDNAGFAGALGIIPGEVRVRCVKIVVALSVVYAVLWLLGFQKLFLNDSEGIAALIQIIGTAL